MDGGASWSSIDGSGRTGLPNVPVHAILVDPEDRERLYVGTDVGVFVSLDGGESWMVENTGFAAAVTETLAITDGPQGSRWLFAFTHGRGSWRVQL
jgi:ligand-binding sensor domain-containing protein